MEKLLKSGTRKIDLLKIGDRYSDNVVNFGFDTTVAITVNEGREKKGSAGKSYYTKGIIRALVKSMRNEFRVWSDGELLNPDGVGLLCTLANGQYVGGPSCIRMPISSWKQRKQAFPLPIFAKKSSP